MPFILGLDVGTVAGVAATKRDGHVDPCELGEEEAEVPSVVVLNGDGTFLFGEEAARAGGQELVRVARDLRRDPMLQADPGVVGDHASTPYPLLRALYTGIVEDVCHRYDDAPRHVVVAHPAVPSGLQCDVVERIADELFPGALLVPEPVAAAVKFACDSAIPVHSNVAIFDLGGGTLDMAVVRRNGDRFTILGDPAAVTDLGGIDIDEMVLDHVDAVLDGAVARLEMVVQLQGGEFGGFPSTEDLEAVDALEHLRAECRRAKEELSFSDEVTIDASLPGCPELVRMQRHQLEERLFPRLEASMDTMEQMVLDAGLELADIDVIGAVGGSVTIPLVRELLEARTGRPVVADATPSLTTALGAAQMVDDDAVAASVFPIAGVGLPGPVSGTAGPAGVAGAVSVAGVAGSAAGPEVADPGEAEPVMVGTPVEDPWMDAPPRGIVRRHVRNGLIGGVVAILVAAGVTIGLRRPAEQVSANDQAGAPFTPEAEFSDSTGGSGATGARSDGDATGNDGNGSGDSDGDDRTGDGSDRGGSDGSNGRGRPGRGRDGRPSGSHPDDPGDGGSGRSGGGSGSSAPSGPGSSGPPGSGGDSGGSGGSGGGSGGGGRSDPPEKTTTTTSPTTSSSTTTSTTAPTTTAPTTTAPTTTTAPSTTDP